jgi:hypothetical protein
MENLKTYKKIGGGSLRIRTGGKSRIIKPNEIFKAYPSDISAAFKHLVVEIDEVDKTIIVPAKAETIIPSEEEKIEVVKKLYSIKRRGKSMWYDIVDSNGKVVNDKALRKDNAEELLKALNE